MVSCTASSYYKAENKSWEFASRYQLPYIYYSAAHGGFDLCNALHAYKCTSNKENQRAFR